MSTSDQQGHGPLTRKQLREMRLTGAAPVIGEEETETAVVEARPTPAAPVPTPSKSVDVVPAPKPDVEGTPLTRRQVREQERIRTASVPVIAAEESEPAAAELFVVDAGDDGLGEEVVDIEPVSAAGEHEAGLLGMPGIGAVDAEDGDEKDDDALPVADPVATGENLLVSPAFGNELLTEKSEVPSFTPSFDELITSDSGGSQHAAPSTLIFTPGEGSLSGPVASTGEILVTGSYELPRGIGSQGHAHGAADGKEADAVLIDGELPPASSPTPIAASSAISTIKPAGEVIRPPAPEKGNKLMLTLAITAGGLALALAVALIVAFSTNIFS